MAGLPAPNGAGGMEWFHLVCGTSGVEMREPMACGTFIRERLPGCKASIPCTFDSIFHFLLIFFFLFRLLKLTSAAVIKERLSSTSLLRDNVQLFPCGQLPANSDTFAIKLLQSLFGRRAECSGTARAGWPSPGHTWPVRLSHTPLQPRAWPQPRALHGSSSRHT